MAKIWKSFLMFVVLVMVMGVVPAIFSASPVQANMSNITVNPYDSNFIGETSSYIITMTTGAMLQPPSAKITIEFPAGTDISAVAAAHVFIKGAVCTTVNIVGQQLEATVPGAVLINPGETFTVTISTAGGITNPPDSSNSGDGRYTVDVWTSVETTHVPSSAYTIFAVDLWESNGTTWKDSYTTIQAAIDAAAAGDHITVPAGTFTENVNVGLPLTI